ncbi:MAG: imidazolonepropionase [Mucilaginibacter sp.]
MVKLIGPFTQILPLSGLPLKGAITDDALQVINNGGVLVENGLVKAIGCFDELRKEADSIEETTGANVLLPGFIDCHTHLCFGGNRAKDYALRVAGKSYLDIAKAGGGIWDTVGQTRLATAAVLTGGLLTRAERHLAAGVTTIEVKSGYGLNPEQELKQLEVIKAANALTKADLIPTCLAAHLLPKDFTGNARAYLEHVLHDVLPVIKKEKLAGRIDIFIEDGAFNTSDALYYLTEVRRQGFDITVHADQFSTGGSEVAVSVKAASADHLEASTEKEVRLLAASSTVAVALPGASLGLGMPYAPARKLLDAGACLAIASDWNPGSAPMGDLLLQAALLGASEKLTTAETFAGLTLRAAVALNLNDRGTLENGRLADMQAYPCSDYREILYYQGKLIPATVWKKGTRTA